MIVAATGHRPDKLGGYGVATHLEGLARHALASVDGIERVISGMALGWDQAVAEAAVQLGIPVMAAVPFEGQARVWPAPAQARYHRILERVQGIVIVTAPAPRSSGEAARAMQARNIWMVDNATHVLALWNGDAGGGTAHCVGYAERLGRPVWNLWGEWSGRLASNQRPPRPRRGALPG